MMTKSELLAELAWLAESYELLSATVEGEYAVGDNERADCEAERQRAARALSVATEALAALGEDLHP